MAVEDAGRDRGGARASSLLAEYRSRGPNAERSAHVPFASLVTLACLGGTIGWVTGHIPAPYGPLFGAGVVAAFTLVVRAAGMGILVDGRRIIARRLVRTHSWPISEVRAFELTEGRGRGSRSVIRVNLHDGSRVIVLITERGVRHGASVITLAQAVDELNGVLARKG